MVNPVRKSTLEIVKHAEYVQINHDRIKKIAARWARGRLVVPQWQIKMHLETDDERTMLDYLIVLDSINFCFWSKQNRWHVFYKGKKYTGYYALSLALRKFFEEYPGKANLAYFSTILQRDFRRMLGGKGQLHLMEERLINVRKVSLRLLNHYEGDSRKFVASAGRSAGKLVRQIAAELYSFNDIAYYKRNKVYFLKRAQLLVADIISAFDGAGIGKFHDAEYLTAMADYKLPQILRHLGILEYSDTLLKKIKKKRRIAEGSQEEIEIRSATIWAVEYLRDALRSKRKRVYAYELDNLLWLKSQKTNMKIPHHFTQTIFY